MPYLMSAHLDPDAPTEAYPFGLPAVEGLPDIKFGDVTVLAGGNGTGKSTLIEALAVASGFNAEGGSKNLMFETYSTHSELSKHLILRYDQRPKWGWFLRAETFYGMASHIHSDDDPAAGVRVMFPDLHGRSHGESFLALIESRMASDGLYFLDEPESALSFHGQLNLLRIMHEACRDGGQFVLATHSPMLMAYPGAKLYELDAEGVREENYDDLDSVMLWRNFLAAPERMFHHLFKDNE